MSARPCTSEKRADPSAPRSRRPAPAALDRDATLSAASAVSRGDERAEVLQIRVDVLTARYRIDGGPSVIVKLWNRPGWRGWLRRATRSAPFSRESIALRRLGDLNGPAPRLLGSFLLDRRSHRHTEALVIEDLGPARDAFDVVAELAGDRADAALADVDDALARLTADMLDAGIVDDDHRLTNMIRPADGRWYRIDFEHARCMRSPARPRRRRGIMLGRLMGTYVFAVQPRLELADRFFERVRGLAGGDRRVRAAASEIVAGMLEQQVRTNNVRTTYELPW